MPDKKYHLVYKTTNLLNNKIYIGVHSTNKIEDGYLGSGDSIKRAIEKYGKENFKREILEYCDSKEEAYDKEAELVDHEFLDREDTYNLIVGGMTPQPHGGSKYNRNKKIDENFIRRQFKREGQFTGDEIYSWYRDELQGITTYGELMDKRDAIRQESKMCRKIWKVLVDRKHDFLPHHHGFWITTQLTRDHLIEIYGVMRQATIDVYGEENLVNTKVSVSEIEFAGKRYYDFTISYE